MTRDEAQTKLEAAFKVLGHTATIAGEPQQPGVLTCYVEIEVSFDTREVEIGPQNLLNLVKHRLEDRI